ncbi:hypothetical protein [Methylobacterium gregans]|uniref:Uncharacterized protein n=1 Tax=Methylobacterium gregans TaxID=374424 RepID=A0AA37HR50_9HYPH|nr:hypothetical protein [Methylobacterium gregans]MDQ0518824.1 hypothetical protein [Methylobacterium gregans]GJD80502.1 hypothetical protein NBEOAGPD_3743 [Methylobacterium gregans]GLS56416.1 hypothetical protein GCM10007886_46010 [Methylobacterium gregans]
MQSYAQQTGELEDCRAADSEGLKRWSFTALQQVLRRLQQSYAVFSRVSAPRPATMLLRSGSATG